MHGEWIAGMELEFKEGIRSCVRGIGPPSQCTALDLGRIAEASIPSAAPSEGGACRGMPISVKDAVLVACWWALREIEASTIRVRQVMWRPGEGACGQCCGLLLPVSKADHMALGKERWHGCACPAAGCPVACVRRLVGLGAAGADGDPLDRPLLPTVAGAFPTKEGMVEAFRITAHAIGHTGRITGHTGRVSGAQALAATGMELWRVQLFCRWGSDVVLKYVRDAALSTSVSFSTEVVRGWASQWTLDELKMAAQARAAGTAGKPWWIQSIAVDEALEKQGGFQLNPNTLIEGTKEGIAELESRPSMKFVVNIKSERVHTTVTPSVTACGWRWPEGSVVETTFWAGEDRCRMCMQIYPEAFD